MGETQPQLLGGLQSQDLPLIATGKPAGNKGFSTMY